MKSLQSKFTRGLPLALALLGYIGYVVSCTHDDQVLEGFVPGDGGPQFSETELVSVKVTSPPVIDGTVDAVWDQAQALKVRTVVPAIGDQKIKEYFWTFQGDAYDVIMKSLYDTENIYFLAEWNDNTESLDRETWYFDPGTKRWKQENRYPQTNADGIKIRDGFYEDKFALLWNVNNSVPDWNTKTCYATCHVQSATKNVQGLARHYTESAEQRVDMWHWKRVREGYYGTMDDQYQGLKGQGNNAGTDNGRYSDPKVAGTGYSDNKQNLVIEGTETTVSVPKYFIPNETYYYWITKEAIDNGTAKLITGVDADGKLYYTGGVLDPNEEEGFLRDGIRSGKKGIPSINISKTQGNQGDITAKFTFTGSKWIMEIQRKLNTGDKENCDVDFSSLEDQYFGIGVFDNAAIAHAIKANLVLKFKK